LYIIVANETCIIANIIFLFKCFFKKYDAVIAQYRHIKTPTPNILPEKASFKNPAIIPTKIASFIPYKYPIKTIPS